MESETSVNMPKFQNESLIGIKSLLKETLDNSVAHAIFKIIETPIFTLKVFLFVCVILSSGLCSYLIIELIMSYLSYGVSTTTRTIYETPALFPKITICNINPFTTKYAFEFLKQINEEVAPNSNVFNDEQMNHLDLLTKLDIIEKIKIKAIFKMNELNETGKRKLSHPIDEILVKLKSFSCTPSDFAWYFDPWYGNCWMINSGLNKMGQREALIKKSLSGENYGLKMGCYVNFYRNLTIINSSPMYGGGLGALIRIDNSSFLTYYISFDGIKLEPGKIVSLGVSRSFKSILPRPYSNCLIDNETNAGFRSELFDLIQKSDYRYTQSLCFFQCWQREILLKCNCTDPARVSLFPNAKKCIRHNETNCMFNMWTNDDTFFQVNCSSDCPLECYSDAFDFSLSSYKLTPKYYLEYLNSNLTNLKDDFQMDKIDADMAKESFVYLTIFYKSLSFELSTETPQLTLITLFANMGGHLGLFLGMSVFSLFEPIQVLIEIVCMKLYKKF